MVTIGTYSAHTALSRPCRLLEVITHNHVTPSQKQSCCWELSALWSATVPPPRHLLPQLLLLATPSPGPAAALAAVQCEVSSTNMAGGSWRAFGVGLISRLAQHCCLHKGTAGNSAGRGQDSSSQPFLRPA